MRHTMHFDLLFLLLMTTTHFLAPATATPLPLYYPDDGGLAPEPDIPWIPEGDQHFDGIPE